MHPKERVIERLSVDVVESLRKKRQVRHRIVPMSNSKPVLNVVKRVEPLEESLVAHSRGPEGVEVFHGVTMLQHVNQGMRC